MGDLFLVLFPLASGHLCRALVVACGEDSPFQEEHALYPIQTRSTWPHADSHQEESPVVAASDTQILRDHNPRRNPHCIPLHIPHVFDLAATYL